jgi:hypothetical protein
MSRFVVIRRAVGIFCLALSAGMVAAADPHAAPKPAGADAAPAWIINGRDKLPKLTRLVAPHAKVRVEAYDLAGKKLFERDDVLHRRTDLNAELKPGEFRLKYFAPDGKQITLTQEVGEVLLLK